MIAEGDPAPDFTLPDHDGSPCRCHLRGIRAAPGPLLRPKAGTPGCTNQACGIRDQRADYEAAGVRVIGISPDPEARV